MSSRADIKTDHGLATSPTEENRILSKRSAPAPETLPDDQPDEAPAICSRRLQLAGCMMRYADHLETENRARQPAIH